MINIPNEILSTKEIEHATGRPITDINLEIVSSMLEKTTLTLRIEIKLNFGMPKSIELKMKKRLLASLEGVKDVKFVYLFDSEELEASGKSFSNASMKNTSLGNRKMVHSKTVFGRKITDSPSTYEDFYDEEERAGKYVVTGTVFNIDSRRTKRGNYIIKILITDKMRGMAIIVFTDKDKNKVIKENIEEGSYIAVEGEKKYDSYSQSYNLDAKAINIREPEVKEDTYPGKKRVELHVHTKMSDNDGFNDVKELVKQCVDWGQTAVAITDHGVVQSFPDAADTAANLRKEGKDIKIIYGLEGYLYPDEDAVSEDGKIDIKKNGTFHIILLAKNKTGLKNLYKIVSKTHIDYFYKKPRLPRSVLDKYREGIIVGSACEAGELYRAILDKKEDSELLKIASYYDYLEIQPRGNNQFLVDDGYLESEKNIIEINKKIVSLSDRLGKMTVATTDSHYPTPEAAINRNIIMSVLGFKDTNSNNLFLKTTDEMMKEFEYLGDRASEIVIDNTNAIADMIESFEPISSDKCPPHIDGADDRLRDSCYDRAHELYGDPLPEAIQDRLDTELKAIIGNGYAVMYVAAQMLVEKSNKEGYLVGSRGSVGSSFAATMAGITEVNPLLPHYLCPKCKHFEFTNDPSKYDCGFDMPDKACPECGTIMHKDGLDIEFATFLGFKGDKEPDIDLNFAGEYQAVAHRYVGKIFGEKNIYKAGTVSVIQEKTAYGYIKHYEEDNNLHLSRPDIDFLVKGCTGVKRTTGQHPGGIIVLPDDREIYDFCPVQRPANKRDSDVITTHFDYHKIDKNLLKLDILGHDVPSMIRMLQDMTGVDPIKIDLGDQKVFSIFTSIDALDIKNKKYRFKHGTYAIPEFGTSFVRQMLDDVQPKSISDLIKMSGLSHGEGVWSGNAQDLIRNKIATIGEVISCRDDIMKYLIVHGIDKSRSFKIMEKVRKNRDLTDEELKIMKEHSVPDWYIDSCETLQYLFPRAHAAAYVMMAVRMAWFKVYYPAEFYATYLTTKIDGFDISCLSNGINTVERAMKKIEDLGYSASAKQTSMLTVYEVIYEAMSRGVEFSMPELGVSHPCNFIVVDGKIKLPFRAVSGVGSTAAESLDEAYKNGSFSSLDEVRRRTKLSGTNIDDLKKVGMFEDVPDSSQISIFDMA